MLKATSVAKAVDVPPEGARARVELDHGRRHLRRCRIDLEGGEKLLVDLPETIALGADDVLLLDDGGHVEIVAADEPLYAVTARDTLHLTELAWHLGNRHLPAEIRDGQILILRDHVIRAMLAGLGAQVTEVTSPFSPLRGAYSGLHAVDHGHDSAQAQPLHRHYPLNGSSI